MGKCVSGFGCVATRSDIVLICFLSQKFNPRRFDYQNVFPTPVKSYKMGLSTIVTWPPQHTATNTLHSSSISWCTTPAYCSCNYVQHWNWRCKWYESKLKQGGSDTKIGCDNKIKCDKVRGDDKAYEAFIARHPTPEKSPKHGSIQTGRLSCSTDRWDLV